MKERGTEGREDRDRGNEGGIKGVKERGRERRKKGEAKKGEEM